MKRFSRILLLIALMLTVASCGWHLRGSQTANDAKVTLRSLSIENRIAAHLRGPDSFEHALDYRLRQLGIQIAGTHTNAVEPQLHLRLLSESSEEQVLSITSDLFEQQIRIKKTVSYQLSDTDGNLLRNSEASTYRDLSQDQSRAAAKNRERELLIEEINRDIADQIIHNLQRTAATTPE